MAYGKNILKAICIVSIVLLIGVVFSGCNPDEVFETGTLTINITGADEFNGKSFHYYIETFLPAERALDNVRVFTGSEVITAGLINMTLKDPDSPEIPYLFKANNVVTVFGYIDVDGNGMNHGGIDKEMDDMLAKAGSGHINGDKVIDAAFPADFHVSETGHACITLLKTGGLMLYHNDDNDMGTVNVGVAKDFIFTIRNTGGAMLNLEGTPLVSLSGATAAPFSVFAQPSSNPIIPNDTESFTIRVLATSAGTYSAAISIPFDDSSNTDLDADSPYTTTISVTTSGK
jgi:hypothetical protein